MLSIRNIVKNKKDFLIIYLLISVITFLFFIGNNTIAEIDSNVRTAFIESITGDVILEKTSDVSMNLFGANTPIIDSFFKIPVLPAYETVMGIISAETGISGITSQVSGNAYLDLLGIREIVLLCGIDAGSYFSLFPGILLEEGRFLAPGEYGAMITSERAKRIEAQSGQRPSIDTPLLLTAGSALGFKIREVPIVGIFSYQNPGAFMNDIVITDPQTVRILNSIQVADNTSVTIEDNAVRLINADPDDIFSDIFSESFIAENENSEQEFSVDLLQNFLKEAQSEKGSEEIGGDWNYIILRLNSGISSKSFIASINKKLKEHGITAVDWRIASGISSISPLLIQALFNSGIFLICIVGIISIINILTVSVFRRMREIGTLRAIGASDSFIRSLIYKENLFVASLAALTGVFCGFRFIEWINGLNLSISNEIIVTLIGGSQMLKFEFLPGFAVISAFVAIILGLAASVYPVEIAVRIQPIEAVRRG